MDRRQICQTKTTPNWALMNWERYQEAQVLRTRMKLLAFPAEGRLMYGVLKNPPTTERELWAFG